MNSIGIRREEARNASVQLLVSPGIPLALVMEIEQFLAI